MSSHGKIDINGKTWGVGSFLISNSDVIIPTDQLHGLSNEEIGEMVMALVPYAVKLNEEEVESHEQMLRESSESVRVKKRVSSPGYVYILVSDNGFYKIGLSRDAKRRSNWLDCKLPFGVKPVRYYITTDMRLLEKTLHEHFGEKRKNGEWFILSENDIDTADSIAIGFGAEMGQI